MNKDAFAGFHPFVNLLFFMAVIGFAMFFMHPVSLVISLFCSLAYSIYIKGSKAVRFSLVFMLPLLLITAALNPLFSHQGATILAFFPNGNPLTLESILFGFAAATMLVTVITWFSCFNVVMTSDKFVFLFGKFIPALSLILSMALRIVPRFMAQIKVISASQRCIGRDISNGNLLRKIKHGIKIISIMITWVLENAIETADSMKGRGYGLPGRTAFSIFKFSNRDSFALGYILFCVISVLLGYVMGAYHFRFFPTVRGQWSGVETYFVFITYFALGAFPMVVNIRESLVWRKINFSKDLKKVSQSIITR
jgi:energy-coupling factor transport system permease protein